MKQIPMLRAAIISLLDDDEGVCATGYDALRGFVLSLGAETDEKCGDIWAAVDSSDGRYYLNGGHGLE